MLRQLKTSNNNSLMNCSLRIRCAATPFFASTYSFAATQYLSMKMNSKLRCTVVLAALCPQTPNANDRLVPAFALI